MDRSLDSLSAALKLKMFEVLARLTERGVMVKIVQTSRTMAEHQANLANGTSATMLSRHLPRALRGWTDTDPEAWQCDAIDLCPYDVYQLHGPDKLQWNSADPAWKVIGELGEAVGLRWGGRWTHPHDPGHLELVVTAPPAVIHV